MFGYYFSLGLRSLRRNPALTALMVLTLAIGVAASMATLTILLMMSGDPIPHKSARLLVPEMDNGPLGDYVPGQAMRFPMLTHKDAVSLLASGQGARRTAVYNIGGLIEPQRKDQPVINVSGVAATADYFAMFDIPFLYGGAWSEAEDKNRAAVVVLSRKQSEKMYGMENPVGRSLRMFAREFRIVGVIDRWEPLPRYTHINIGGGANAFDGDDQIHIPFGVAADLHLASNGSTSCPTRPAPGYQGLLDSECLWVQFWFEATSVGDVPAIKTYIDAYTAEQKKLGRFQRPTPNQLHDLMAWLARVEVVEKDNRIAVWLAFGFLLLCLINTIGLLLAKFSVRAAEVGVRRALGATRLAIFQQFMVETIIIGLVGGFAGLLLSLLSLWLIGLQSDALSALARMDWPMLGLTLALATLSSILAGLLPTWRACQVTPAIELKSQ